MTIRPITLRAANAYVAQHHRHNQPTNGHKWSVACYDGDRLCGVAIAEPVTLAVFYTEPAPALPAIWAISEL